MGQPTFWDNLLRTELLSDKIWRMKSSLDSKKEKGGKTAYIVIGR